MHNSLGHNLASSEVSTWSLISVGTTSEHNSLTTHDDKRMATPVKFKRTITGRATPSGTLCPQKGKTTVDQMHVVETNTGAQMVASTGSLSFVAPGTRFDIIFGSWYR